MVGQMMNKNTPRYSENFIDRIAISVPKCHLINPIKYRGVRKNLRGGLNSMVKIRNDSKKGNFLPYLLILLTHKKGKRTK